MSIAEKIKNFFNEERRHQKECTEANVKDEGSHVFSMKDLIKMKEMATIGVFATCLVKSHLRLHSKYEKLKIDYNAVREHRDLRGKW